MTYRYEIAFGVILATLSPSLASRPAVADAAAPPASVESSVTDVDARNVRVDAPSGVVRAFDVKSGRLAWAFDLAPPPEAGPALAGLVHHGADATMAVAVYERERRRPVASNACTAARRKPSHSRALVRHGFRFGGLAVLGAGRGWGDSGRSVRVDPDARTSPGARDSIVRRREGAAWDADVCAGVLRRSRDNMSLEADKALVGAW